MQKISLVQSLINNKDPLSTKNALLNYLTAYSLDSWSTLDKANFYTLLAKYSSFSANFSESLQYFELAKKYFDLSTDNEPINYLGDYYYHLSFLEIDLGNLAEAKDLAILCYEYYKKRNVTNGIGKAYDLLSQISLKFLDFDEAIDYAQKSIDILEESKTNLHVSYNNLGEIFRIKGDLQLALKCYERSFEVGKANDDLHLMGVIYNNYGLIYAELEEQDRALQNFENSYECFKKLDIFDYECELDYTEFMISIYSPVEINNEEYLNKIELLLSELRKHIQETGSNNYLFNYIALLGQFEAKRNNFYTAEQFFLFGKMLSDATDNLALKIIIRIHIINLSLKLYNIEHSFYYLEKAKSFLEEAKAIAYETQESTLLAEIKIIEAIILTYKDKPEANFILGQTMNFARKINNIRLISKITREKTRLNEKYTIQKGHTDIIQYINSIARLTNVPQRE